MKTYLAYDMMRFMEVPAPLCSYVWVKVNGEDWGLYLAVEEPDTAFVKRNFGKDAGKLYKPDYRSLNDANKDIALQYTGEDFANYSNIFDNAVTDISNEDKERLIKALKDISSNQTIADAVNTNLTLKYFAVHVFTMNWDSYLGHTGHNYFLYEEDGKIAMLPWDYNLAFGTYALGMPEPVTDPNVLINYPISTPAPGNIMTQRPLYHNLMMNDDYFKEYRDNLAEISFMQKILFVGMNKYSKEQVDTIKEKYNKFGMHFGWLGTRAVLYVDDITDNIKDIKNFKSEYENFLKYSQKYDIEHKDILEPFIKENKKMFINAMTLLVPYGIVGRTTKIAYDLNKIRLEIKKQKYETLIKIFYIEGLKNFMEG